MYDDDVQPPLSLGSVSKYTKVAKFPTRNIKTPIVLVYGGSDSLVDISVMLRELPAHTVATEIPHYEHLDFLWAREVNTLVFPHVFDALESFCDAEHSKEEYARYRTARHASLGATLARPLLTESIASEDEVQTLLGSYATIASTQPGSDADALISPRSMGSTSTSNTTQNCKTTTNTRKRARIQVDYDGSSESGSSPIVASHIQLIRADEEGVNGNGTTAAKEMRKMRSGSIGSNISFDSGKPGARGISLGVGRAVSAVVKGETRGSMTGAGAVAGIGIGSDDGGTSEFGGRRKGKR